MVESLGDTYSVFLDPDNAASLTQLLNGSYEGIGIILDKYDGKFIIANIIKNGIEHTPSNGNIQISCVDNIFFTEIIIITVVYHFSDNFISSNEITPNSMCLNVEL